MAVLAFYWKVKELDFSFLKQKTQSFDLILLEFCYPYIDEEKGDSISASQELPVLHLLFLVLL